MNLNNVFKKFLAFLLVFSLVAPTAEAAGRGRVSRSTTRHQAKAVRVAAAARAKAARVAAARAKAARIAAARAQAARVAAARAQAARVAAARAKAARVAAARTQAARVAAARTQAARVAAARAEAARVAAIRQQRIAAWNAAAPIRQQYRLAWNAAEPAFLAAPFENPRVIQRPTLGNFLVPFAQCDLGYQGLPTPARTAQYGIGIPAATVLHPYNMEQNTRDYQTAAFYLNARYHSYNPDFGPEELHHHLVDINPSKIECYVIVQDMPWNGGLQVKPQSYLKPDARYQEPHPRNYRFQVSVGVFPTRPHGPRIQGQPREGLIENHPLFIHNGKDKRGVFHPELISSGDSLLLERLNTNFTQTFFSVTKQGGRAAIVYHVLLNRLDGQAFSDELNLSGNLNALKNRLQGVRAAGVRFQDLDLNELF